MKISDMMRSQYSYMWDRLFSHPFVVEMGDGTLDLGRFRFYITQDYYFLVQYSRVLAIAAAKSPDLSIMTQFASLMKDTLDVEMDLHRQFCAKFGVSISDLESTKPAPMTMAYTDYLLRVAYEGGVTDIVATLLPCQWGYSETGLHLAKTGDTTQANRFYEWIQMYSSAEFTQFVSWLRSVMDEWTVGANQHTMDRVSAHFMTATRYEFLFWDMSYNLQDWPI